MMRAVAVVVLVAIGGCAGCTRSVKSPPEEMLTSTPVADVIPSEPPQEAEVMPHEPQGTSQSTPEQTPPLPTEDELRKRLTAIQFHVTQEKGTERPGTGEYWRFFQDGVYQCVCCGQRLFTSDSKFPTECGWPGFDRAIDDDVIHTETDYTHNMVRTEVTCSRCGAHLGHVFNDGPTTTGLRYCMNSASLKFIEAQSGAETDSALKQAQDTSTADADQQ